MTPEQQTAAYLKCQDAIERLENENMKLREALIRVATWRQAGVVSPEEEQAVFDAVEQALTQLQPFLTEPKQ